MGPPPKIMIVDDEEHIGYLVKFQMERSGYEVTWKMDGRSALESIKSGHPDLVILDVMIPGISGLEVLEIMKADATLNGIPVIMLSSLAQEADLIKAFDLGAADYLTKPFSPGELLVRVKRLIPAH